MPSVAVRYEQAVYGSFPFWDRGYALLAHSPGCRPEWLAGLRAACQRFGERPAGAAEAPALFALRLEAGPWMIVGVDPQGCDDRGRPGALAFHALFVDPRAYRRAGASPFAFAGALRHEWTAETRTLTPGTWTVNPAEPHPEAADDRAVRIASALARGQRVALASPEPIDALARQVWLALPATVRARASVATWAFGNANRFDLVALPRLAGIELDPTYVDPSALEAGDTPAAPGTSSSPLLWWGLVPLWEPLRWRTGARALSRRWGDLGLVVSRLAVGGLVLLVGLALALHRRRDDEPDLRPPSRPGPPPAAAPVLAPPDRASYRADPADPEEVRRVAEGLVDLAERFGVADPGSPPHGDPAGLMAMLSQRLRYRGPFLSAAERAELESASGPTPGTARDRTLALEWDARVRRFADDRPLPEGFAQGPLRWQLDTLAWSFHLDDDPAARLRSPAEVPHAIADALAVDIPLSPTPLASRHPALEAYRAFLDRLPRRDR